MNHHGNIASDNTTGTDHRPEFLVALGLQLPVTIEDVRQAYKLKAKSAHPDGGGDADQFKQLHTAYEQGLEYAEFHDSRRKWIGDQIENYLSLQRVITTVEDIGGRIELQKLAWLRGSVGEDFAQVTDFAAGIFLNGTQANDATIEALHEERGVLQRLTELNLAGTRITDISLERIQPLGNVRRLDLSNTGITNDGLKLLREMESLDWLNLTGTSVNWWGRTSFRRACPAVEMID